MFKKSGLVFLLFCFFNCLSTAAPLANDTSFIHILKESDKQQQERKLVKYIRRFYQNRPLDSLQGYMSEMNNLFIRYKLNNRPAINYYINYFYQQRLRHSDIAETSLVNAIQLVAKRRDRYLSYVFYTDLGFLQTDRGNTAEAVYSYSIARKQAVILNDPSYQVIVDINISDIFFRNSFYSQSLSYLKQAQDLVTSRSLSEQRFINIIYRNSADNYFKLGNLDSVRKYNRLLNAVPDGSYYKYVFAKLTDYYVSFLQGDYQKSVSQIRALKTDSLYSYDTSDEQNLADAYYHANMPDSAKRVLVQLLKDPSLKNHPEIKYHLYKVLGHIAGQQHKLTDEAYNYKMALQQSEEQIGRLTQVDNIASQIKIDEAEDAFLQKEESYKKERLGLIYVLVITLLTIAIIAIIFNATRQKRYYERLVFDAKKKELSFINSHEVRRHLSNLLGLIDVIKNSDDKQREYLEAEPYIIQEANSLDGAIKNISEKLEGDTDSSGKITG
jgi:hypothetical protein